MLGAAGLSERSILMEGRCVASQHDSKVMILLWRQSMADSLQVNGGEYPLLGCCGGPGHSWMFFATKCEATFSEVTDGLLIGQLRVS